MECNKAPKTKHISYPSREDYITDPEEMLMQKYRVGCSALYKRLVVEKAISCSTEQFDQRSTKDSTRSQVFGFNRFGETRNETDVRHLLIIDIVGVSVLT